MHVISRKTLKEAAEKHADAETQLDAWYRVASKATWQSIMDIRRTYSSADPVGAFTVFNIKGNMYRLIVKIDYKHQMIFIKGFLTHAEYNKDAWKK